MTRLLLIIILIYLLIGFVYLTSARNFCRLASVGIGGGHYNHVANKVMLKTNLTAGHIRAKYNLENLDYALIKKAMEKAVPKSKFVLLDWKGLGKEKQRIVEILEKTILNLKEAIKSKLIV